MCILLQGVLDPSKSDYCAVVHLCEATKLTGNAEMLQLGPAMVCCLPVPPAKQVHGAIARDLYISSRIVEHYRSSRLMQPEILESRHANLVNLKS